MAEQPLVASKAPYQAKVKAGRTYFWCSCECSTNQPLCDGTHARL